MEGGDGQTNKWWYSACKCKSRGAAGDAAGHKRGGLAPAEPAQHSLVHGGHHPAHTHTRMHTPKHPAGQRPSIHPALTPTTRAKQRRTENEAKGIETVDTIMGIHMPGAHSLRDEGDTD